MEAFNLFRAMIDNVNKKVISFLFKGNLPTQENQQIQDVKEVRQQENDKLSKDEIDSPGRSSTWGLNSESADRKGGCASASEQAKQTQQKKVIETIVRDMPKLIVMTT